MIIKEPKKINGFKIIHKIPDYSEEEREEKKKEIVRKLYNYFRYNDQKTLDTKVKL